MSTHRHPPFGIPAGTQNNHKPVEDDDRREGAETIPTTTVTTTSA
jgi:hypothetical protein